MIPPHTLRAPYRPKLDLPLQTMARPVMPVRSAIVGTIATLLIVGFLFGLIVVTP